MTKKEVLKVLLESDGNAVSGEALAKDLNVSRMAINKAVSALREEGYAIDAKERKGYILNKFDLLKTEVIKKEFDGIIKPYFYESLKGSSNNEAKAIAAANHDKPFVVITESQGGGKGRLGRSFSSPKGGLYFSIYLPSDMLADGDLITTNAALAVALTVEEVTGLDIAIKWVNDLYLNGKKFVGILTEGIVDLELGGLSGAIIGIGINANTTKEDYPEELREILTTLKDETGKEVDRLELLVKVVKNVIKLQKENYIEEYRKRCFVIGQDLTVNKMGKVFNAKAIDVDDRARLVVEYEDGRREALTSAEVTLHKES